MKEKNLTVRTLKIVALTILLAVFLSACGIANINQQARLQNKYDKYLNHGAIIKREYSAVKDFDDWQNKDQNKPYDD